MTHSLDRRALLKKASMLALTAIGSAQLKACASLPERKPNWTNYPFSLGVASGDPVSDGFVIWTRILSGLADQVTGDSRPIPIIWEVAADDQMRKVIQWGEVNASPEVAHAVHIEVRGLPPGRSFWYRFRIPQGDASPVGHAWTVPAEAGQIKQLRLAIASCQHFEQGYFTAYHQMMSDHPDLILHLGDYIYESSWGDPIRRHDGAEPHTLGDYRNRHALYKTDPHLQAAHARCPWLVTWDDHEVDNDYQALESEDWQDPNAFLARRAAAYQAYYEHMPLRRIAQPRNGAMQLYQRSAYSDLLMITMLDNRQYRSPAACRNREKGGGQVVDASCKALQDPARSLLGPEQEKWLKGSFSRSRAKWNLIGNGEMFSRLYQKTRDGKEGWWTDDWNGFPPARERIIEAIMASKVSNPVFVTGDIHSYWVNDVKSDFRDPSSATIATELVGTSITSAGVPYDQFAAIAHDNPHVKFFDSRKRGYILCKLSSERMDVELRTVDTIKSPESGGSTLGKFVIESGRPGARPG